MRSIFGGAELPRRGDLGVQNLRNKFRGCSVRSTALSGPFPGQLCGFRALFPSSFGVLPPFLPPIFEVLALSRSIFDCFPLSPQFWGADPSRFSRSWSSRCR